MGTKRGLTGDDGGNFGDESEEVAVQVRDLRAAAPGGGRTAAAGREPTLEREGFVLKRFYEELGGQYGGGTGSVSYSDTLGTREKCHSIQLSF